MSYPYSTMSKLAIFVSATIVLILTSLRAGAAPQPEVPPDSPTEEKVQERAVDENMAIAEPAPLTHVPPPANQRYYAYRQALTVRGGIGIDLSNDEDSTQKVLGVQYTLPRFLSPRWEIGADLHNDGNGHIHFGLRRVFYERDFFRPSMKAGLDHWVDSKENLATFGHSKNYFFQATGTIEFVVWDPFSIRLEQEFLFGIKKTWTVSTVGLTYGF